MTSNNGFNENCITLNYEGEDIGVATIDEDGKAALGTEDDAFLGIIKNARNGISAVQVKGQAVVPYSGELAVGIANVVCDGDGGITPAESGGREIIVLNVGTDTAEIIM